jgi:hypothetical protein
MKRVFALLLLVAPSVFAVALGPEWRLGHTLSAVYVATADGYVAFWNDDADLKAVHIAPDGTMGAQATVAHDFYVGGAARDGDSIVVIAQQSSNFRSPIYAFRVGPDLHAGNSIVIFGGSGAAPSIVADRGELFAGWFDGASLVLAHLDASLHTVGQKVLRLGTGVPRPSTFVLAPSLIGLLVAWDELIACQPGPLGDPCIQPTRVRAARVSFDLTAADATGIDLGMARSSVGGAWWDGTVWNVLWTDSRNVNLSRIDASGMLLDVAPRVVLASPSRQYFSVRGSDGYVAAKFAGTAPDYLSGVVLARLTGNGIQQATLLNAFSIFFRIVPGADGRALFGYDGGSPFDAVYRIVDFNAEGGRPRPAR